MAIYPVFSRVIHIGTCGLHHKGKNCDPKDNVDKLVSMFAEKPSAFFPKSFELSGIYTGIRTPKKSNGGWSDPRDIQLCKQFFYSTNSTSYVNLNIRI